MNYSYRLFPLPSPAPSFDIKAILEQMVVEGRFAPRATTLLGDASAARKSADPRGTLEAVTEALAHIPNNDLDGSSWIMVGNALKAALGEDGRGLWLDWSRQSSKSGASGRKDTPERRWDGFRPREVGAGTIYHLARQAGWRPAPHLILRGTTQDAVNEGAGADLIASLENGAISQGPGPASLIQRLIYPVDCTLETGRRYVVKSLLAIGDVAAIVGQPGCGKSILAPHLGYAVAQGRRLFGLRTKPGRVLYAVAEDLPGMRQRIHALRLQHGDTQDFALLQIGNLTDGKDAAVLRAAVDTWQPTLVIIDTVGAAWAGMDENAPQDMGQVVKLSRELAALGCAVLLVHHAAKQGDGSPRGHSVLNGTLDMCLSLAPKDDAGVIRGTLAKNRNGASDREIAFRFEVVTLGTDEDGDAITAPRAVEATDDDPSRSSRRDRLPRALTAGLEALRELAAKTEDGRVPESEWRDECDNRRISASDNPKSRRDVITRTMSGLIDRKLIVASGGLLSVATEPGAELIAALTNKFTGDPD